MSHRPHTPPPQPRRHCTHPEGGLRGKGAPPPVVVTSLRPLGISSTTRHLVVALRLTTEARSEPGDPEQAVPQVWTPPYYTHKGAEAPEE